MAGEIRAKASSLEQLRAQQLSLRMILASTQDKATASSLKKELKLLDKKKAQLKKEAAGSFGVKLSRHAKDVPKRGSGSGTSGS